VVAASAVYLFEVGNDLRPTRQIEVYENGRKLRYGPGRLTDEFGMLSDQPLDPDDFVVRDRRSRVRAGVAGRQRAEQATVNPAG